LFCNQQTAGFRLTAKSEKYGINETNLNDIFLRKKLQPKPEKKFYEQAFIHKLTSHDLAILVNDLWGKKAKFRAPNACFVHKFCCSFYT
jgi:hypothetical protein